MPNETGDMKFLGNFRKLIDMVKSEPTWKPTNPLLDPKNMEIQYAAALSIVEDLPVKLAPLKVAINNRDAGYEAMDQTIRDSRRILKSTGASQALIDDANTYARKALGERKKKKPIDDPETPANEAEAAHSASQLSYDNKLASYRSYIQILINEPLYNPNETYCQTTEMTKAANNLETLNDSISTISVPVRNVRVQRDDAMYLATNSIFAVQSLAKKYAPVAFKNQPAKLEALRNLKFKRP